jgi:hypothetical protein
MYMGDDLCNRQQHMYEAFPELASGSHTSSL